LNPLLRRSLLAYGGLGGSALIAAQASAQTLGNPTFGNPDQPAQGAVNASPQALADPGPHNSSLANQFPSALSPPATDVSSQPPFWSSFNIQPRRIQAGGWARQVTQREFPLATTIAGVNMRLDAGGLRELHWHLASEWAYMTKGRCRITLIDEKGRPYIQDVGEGDIWFFPAGLPHSLQGLGPDGCEFILAFGDGDQSEYSTLLVTDWLAHTPPEVLAANFGVPAESLSSIPLNDLWIFQAREPGPLAADQAAVAGAGAPPNPFTFPLGASRPFKESAFGSVRLADSTIFKAANTTAAAIETIKPGCIRTMHWHPNADEWQYYLQGTGRMTVFGAGPRATTADFRAGDVGNVTRASGHYIQNTGDTDLVFLAVFRTAEYQEVSLADWLARTPPAMVSQHFNLDPAVVARFPKNNPPFARV
jgi:oxalate decarboxylase